MLGGANVTSGASGSGNNLAATVNVPAGAGNGVVFTVSGTALASATANLVNTATVSPPNNVTDADLANNTATDTDTAALQADLRITKDDGSLTYTPGNLVRYTITVSNNGPSDAVGATVADLVPAILTSVSWTTSVLGGANVTSGASGSGNNLAATVNVPAGAGNGVVFTVSGTALASATANLVNTATVSPPGNVTDTDLANNTATDTDTAALQADLRITKDDGSLTYTPGNLVRYTITVNNLGPSDAVGATVADLVPAILTGVSWTSSALGGANVTSGTSGFGNNLAATVNVPAGAGNGVVFTVSGTALASATANLVNTATVSPPNNVADTDLANNTATDTDTAALQADLRITKDDGSLTYTPGNLVRYTITVSNLGPSDAVGATVADLVPAILTSVSWTSSALGGANVTSGASGFGNNLAATVNVPAGAGNGVVFTVSGTASASATTNLVNTATISPPNNVTDTDLANNTATDTDTAALQADLRITKDDGSLTYTPGNLVRYTITVSNNGPSDAVGATVADLVPAILTSVSWTTSVLGGANVTSGASGSGNNLAATVNVPADAGNGVVFTVSGTALASATANLVNTATVSPPNNVTDADLANNTATDTDTAALQADLRITKDDGSLTYTPGNLVRYTITVSNNGPSDAVGATVADLVPAILTGVSWTTSVLGGANVTSGASGSGNNLAATVNVPAGAGNGVVFTVSGTALASATANLVNTATVSPPSNVTDTDLANNTATDTDTAALQADLRITKDDGSPTYTPGNLVRYTITVSNLGPSDAVGATVADLVPAILTGVSWTSSALGRANVTSGASGFGNNLAATVNVPAGAGNGVVFTVSGTASASATTNLVNTATVSPPNNVTDTDLANNTATDTDTAALQADLRITKDDGSLTYTPGNLVRYTITVSNLGPSDAVGATVADLVPAILTSVSWTSSVLGGANVTNGASGSGNNLAATVNVPAGAGNGVVFTVSGTAAASATANLVNTATVSPPANVTDMDLANNTATDTDTAALQADLRITKDDGSLTYTPGNLVRYTITVSNNGPSDAVGATVADLVPAILTSVSWTSNVLGGANITSGASGSGNNLAAMVNVPAGAGNGVVFTVSGTAVASATANLVNTATVSPPNNVTDTDLANNTATDVDTAALQADLRITKDDGSPTYTRGTWCATPSRSATTAPATPSERRWQIWFRRFWRASVGPPARWEAPMSPAGPAVPVTIWPPRSTCRQVPATEWCSRSAGRPRLRPRPTW